jgi:hypothetical protein
MQPEITLGSCQFIEKCSVLYVLILILKPVAEVSLLLEDFKVDLKRVVGANSIFTG